MVPMDSRDFRSLRNQHLRCGRSLDYGPDAGDDTKVFRFSGNYAFPRLRSKGIVDQAINGWNLSAITNWQTGFPFTSFAEDDNSFSAMGNDRPDITVANISDTQLSTKRSHSALINEWFNTADFVPNAIGTYGTSARILFAPKLFTTDLALLKSGKIGERANYEFRAEFTMLSTTSISALPMQASRQQLWANQFRQRSSHSPDGFEGGVLTNL